MKNVESSEAKREQALAESIWLNYFNRYLFEKGTISQKEFSRMSERITGYQQIRHQLEKTSDLP